MLASGVVGVPDMTPVLAFRASPAGNAPVDTLQLIGGVPPVVCKVALYALPTVPLGSEVVVIPRGTALTVMLNVSWAVTGGMLESVANAVKFEVPAAVGMPEITPKFVSSVSPAGNDPLAKLHETGAIPPALWREAL